MYVWRFRELCQKAENQTSSGILGDQSSIFWDQERTDFPLGPRYLLAQTMS